MTAPVRAALPEPTFAAWRDVARRLLASGTPPDRVVWESGDDGQAALALGDADAPRETPPSIASPRVPTRFLALAEAAACHADPARWPLLYRLLWRQAHGEPRLVDVATDPDVHRLLRMERAVRREVHKMKAFVRFRAVAHEGETVYVAWFEPAHPVVERAAPFFAERFASQRWSILTPLRCAHGEAGRVRFTPGAARADAPDPDALESLWRTYYAHTFNPARVRPSAMRAEMPVRYWRNLPEASLIAPLTRDAPARVRRMIEQRALDPALARPARRRRDGTR